MDVDESYLEALDVNDLAEEITKIQALVRGVLVRKQMAEIQELYEQIVNDIDGEDTEVVWPETKCVGKPTIRRRTSSSSGLKQVHVTGNAGAQSFLFAQHKSVASVFGSSSVAKRKSSAKGKKRTTRSRDKLSISEMEDSDKTSRDVGDLAVIAGSGKIAEDVGEIAVEAESENVYSSARRNSDDEDVVREDLVQKLNLNVDKTVEVVCVGEKEMEIDSDKSTAHNSVTNGAPVEIFGHSNAEDYQELFKVDKTDKSETNKELESMKGTALDLNSAVSQQLVCAEVQTEDFPTRWESESGKEKEDNFKADSEKIRLPDTIGAVTSVQSQTTSKENKTDPDSVSLIAIEKTDKDTSEAYRTERVSHTGFEELDKDQIPATGEEDGACDLPEDKQELVELKNSVIMELLWVQQAIVSRKNYLRMRQQVQ